MPTMAPASINQGRVPNFPSSHQPMSVGRRIEATSCQEAVSKSPLF